MVIPRWLYDSFCGTSVCPRCHKNSLFRLLHLAENVNTQDFDALNLKRHLHEYEYATSNNIWSCTGEVEMNDRSSASEGQLLLTPRTPEFGLLSSKSFIKSLINTKYKKVDNTPPCRTPWCTENHLDRVWLKTTELTVLEWQFCINDQVLPVIQRLKSLNRSPFLQTISKALLVSRKLT